MEWILTKKIRYFFLSCLCLITMVGFSQKGDSSVIGKTISFKKTCLNIYEFKIYQNGAIFSKKKKKYRVQAFVRRLDKDNRTFYYQSLRDTSSAVTKYSYSFYSENELESIVLKLYAGSDSMFVLTNCSQDSLLFKTGSYNFNYDYSYPLDYLAYLVPMNSQVTIQIPNTEYSFSKRTKIPPALPLEPTYRNSTGIMNFSFLKSSRSGKTIYIGKHRTFDSSSEPFKQAAISYDAGITWKVIQSPFKDDVFKDVCLSDETNFIVVKRDNKELKFLLDDYFNGKAIVPDLNTSDSTTCPDETPIFQEQELFPMVDPDLEYDESRENIPDDTIRIDGKNIFVLTNHNVKFFRTWTKEPEIKYFKLDRPLFYRFKEKKILLFDQFFLYSENGLEWNYYGRQEMFIFFEEEQGRGRYKYWDVKFYWIEGKGLMIDSAESFLIHIDVN